MKPAAFCYHRPNNRAEVDELLTELLSPEVYLLAGGQSLVPALSARSVRPEHVVDLNHLHGEPVVPVAEGDRVRIGPHVRMSTLRADRRLAGRLPILAEMIAVTANTAVRNRATVIGNVMCGEIAAEFPALAILLNAQALVRRDGETSVVPVAELASARRTRPAGGPAGGAWTSEIILPLPDPQTRFAFAESARRHSATAVAGVVAMAGLTPAGPVVRACVFGVGTRPFSVTVTSSGEYAGGLADEIGQRVRAGVQAQDDVHASADHRRSVAADLAVSVARRALTGQVRR
jgi:carbon-monoxide dehydrogenase medium subunit